MMNIKMVKKAVQDFLKDEEGASGIEYALVAAMVAVALIAFVAPVRDAIVGVFTDIQGALEDSTD
ncbi:MULTISPECIES: Flp family type IVb pilin [unclassified Methylophaga]|uniref:Flp family type IVb pilin n=1 Tax=unclassified Methylophaga TaxID=2629249 RepID=UPI0025E18357|nr:MULTISPECIES: Flp family type IVb pilin [unclassified Methylophaga]